ncbi:hypothetical protein DMENIID0001_111970 [Sergentomyia squamirostris]
MAPPRVFSITERICSSLCCSFLHSLLSARKQFRFARFALYFVLFLAVDNILTVMWKLPAVSSKRALGEYVEIKQHRADDLQEEWFVVPTTSWPQIFLRRNKGQY